MTQKWLFLCMILSTASAWGQRYEPIIKPLGMADKIVVRGYDGTLQIVPTASETLKVEALKKKGDSGWNFEVRQKQNTIEVLVKNSADQESWDKLRTGENIPTFDIKITAPKVAMEVFWNSGLVFSDDWHSDLSVQMTQGKAKFTKGEGNLRLQLISGQIEVKQQQGRIGLQTFKGQVLLEKNKGDLVIDNHSSLYTLNGHQGPVEYNNHSGSTNLKDVKGNVSIRNVSGVVRIRGLDGSLQGELSKGTLDAKLKTLQNVALTSDEANVVLDAPKESGALVLLRSEKGRMSAPIHLRKMKKGRWTERKGKLKGKDQGHIKIVSKYGDIVLK